MKKAILVAAILIAPSQSSYGADWQYDFRRCTVGHEVGDFYIRISSLYPVEFDIMKNLDKSGVDFKVASVRIDQDDFSEAVARVEVSVFGSGAYPPSPRNRGVGCQLESGGTRPPRL